MVERLAKGWMLWADKMDEGPITRKAADLAHDAVTAS